MPLSFASFYISSGVRLDLSNKAINSGFEILPPFFFLILSISFKSSFFVNYFFGDPSFWVYYFINLSFSSLVSLSFLKASGSPAIIFSMSSLVRLIPFYLAISQIYSSVNLGTYFSSFNFFISSFESSSFFNASLSPAIIYSISSLVNLTPFSFAIYQIYSSVNLGASHYSLISLKSSFFKSNFFMASLSPFIIFWISSSDNLIPFFFIRFSISARVKGSFLNVFPINLSSFSNFSSSNYSS